MKKNHDAMDCKTNKDASGWAMIILICIIIFSSCKTYYYLDSCGNGYSKSRKATERQLEKLDQGCGIFKYYFVIKNEQVIKSGIVDTTHFKVLPGFKIERIK